MFLWFLAGSFAAVMLVFDSPALDYRLVMVGSVLPWLDFAWGPPWPMHSVFFPVFVMVAVMIGGWGRRLAQRRWLGLAIGGFVHLLLAATWLDAELFWWPALGLGVGDARPPVPPVPLAVALEVVGAAVGIWLWRRLGMAHAPARAAFARTGRIDRTTFRTT